MKDVKIILSGCGGRLGKFISSLAPEKGCTVVCGIDIKDDGESFPVYDSIEKAEEDADVIVDCSHHSLAVPLAEYAVKKGLPLVICTTGHTPEEEEKIKAASEKVAVLKSRNMSLGINLLMELVKKATATLGDGFDIEIIEEHHRKKLDAPSGTALMLADAAKSVREDAEYIYDRHEVRRERGNEEIGIHSVRGGTIVGEHKVIFAGEDEVITLSHSAGSRRLFAAGALAAAEYIADKPAGYYTMSDVVK